MGLHETAHQIANVMARQLDDLLREAISRALGHADWTLPELEGRLFRLTDPKTKTDTYFVDEIPVLEVHPIRTELTHTGMSHTMTAHQPYRFLIEEPQP